MNVLLIHPEYEDESAPGRVPTGILTIGTMLKSGLLDPELIFHFGVGTGPIMSWKKWKPYILWTRERMNAPDYMAGFEYYANEMMRLRKERGYSAEWSLEESRWL